MFKVFLLIFLCALHSSYSTDIPLKSCEWEKFRSVFDDLHSGYLHSQSCRDSLEFWSEDDYSWKFNLDSKDTRKQCECLVGLSAHFANDLNCALKGQPPDDWDLPDPQTLSEWKSLCESNYCVADNPEHFCYCDVDDLKNQWNVDGENVKQLCSDMLSEWNEGAYATKQSCECFEAMPSKGLDLGCKFATDQFSKPWEKSPSLGKSAKMCLDFDYKIEEEEPETFERNAPMETVTLQLDTGKEAQRLLRTAAKSDSAATSISFLVFLLVGVASLCIVFLYFNCCFTSKYNRIGSNFRTESSTASFDVISAPDPENQI